MEKIKLFDPTVSIKEEKTLNKVLRSHFWASGAGVGYVLKFEGEFKKYIGSDDCVAVNSGTAALHLALSLGNIKNNEVILPSLSFVATAHAIILNGARPVFVDIDPKTLCIDPNQIKKSITKKTRIILPVHFGGMSCNLDEIKSICNQYNLILVEDAAHAVGSLYKNRKIGTHGLATCFSFHPVKNLAMPTGGLISLNHVNHRKFRKLLNARRWCGITNRRNSTYDVREIGWNYYMNEFSAAIGLDQLKKLDDMNRIRRSIAKKYYKEINVDEKMPFNEECAYHMYWILVRNRNKFRKSMTNVGIETGIHYRPIHTLSLYKNKKKLTVTERVGCSIVTIPIHQNLTEDNVEKIISSVNKFI